MKRNSVPQLLKVKDYLAGGPQYWLNLRAELVLSFQLSEYGAVDMGQYTEFARNSLKEALRVVCAPRKSFVLFNYTLLARDKAPLISWDADSSLSRYGHQDPTKRVNAGQKNAEIGLLTLYQFLPVGAFDHGPHPYHEPIVRLRVGGRTSKEAVANWHQCARSLRRLRNGNSAES